MDSLELMHGTAPTECVQWIIGDAFRKHTPESMRHAAHKLEGIRLMLSWMGYDLQRGSDFVIRVNNEILRCYQAADLIAEGKL